MRIVFADTGYWIALLNPRDDLHDKAGASQFGYKLVKALPAGSPAIDAGSNPDSLTTDQRGLTRPVGAGTDIGAFEFQ